MTMDFDVSAQDMDQREAIAFLSDPASYGGAEPVALIETHISRIFLVGTSAYKMKRAVLLPYADFSKADLRLSACQAEVELNSRTAPGLYRGVRHITRGPDGRLCFDGQGPLVDAVVEMQRFDQETLFDHMALSHQLTPALMTDTALMIARFHRAAPVVHAGGGKANIAAVLSFNEAGFRTSRLFTPSEQEGLNAAFREALERHAPLLDRREREGKVRRCHGDLHLRNILLSEGQPCLFDCIEFNEAIATVDVLYDLAFLLMDLWHRGLTSLANITANRYFDETGDEEGYGLLPFFIGLRAAVRAHVTATAAEGSGDPSGEQAKEARRYFDLAHEALRPSHAGLVALGGFSGSGKTTVAEALAPQVGAMPGARILETDRIRKAMHGVSPETRLPQEAYRPDVSQRVYAELVARARSVVASGGVVVAAAVFDRTQDRKGIEGAVAGTEAADPAILLARVSARRGGASDATPEVLALQLAATAGSIGWPRCDARQAVSDTAQNIAAAFEDKTR